MATTPTSTTEVTDALQAALVDLVDISLIGKQAHWNLYGPHFRSVHLHLDEIIDESRAASDDVAERLVTIGHPADGRADERSEEHTSELQSRFDLVCRLLLDKKKKR